MEVLLEHGFYREDGTCPVGFSLHVADVYMAELMRVTDRSPDVVLTQGICIKLVRPFISVMQNTQQTALLQRVRCVLCCNDALTLCIGFVHVTPSISSNARVAGSHA
jgi:hypothetical protein